MFAALVLQAALAATPPVIVRTHSAPFCTALRERIVPAVLLLRQNTRLLGVVPQRGPETGMEHVALENVVDGVVRNNAALDRLLAASAFQGAATTKDDRELRRLRGRLRRSRMLAEQMLNITYGVSETQALVDAIDSTVASPASPNGAPARAPLHTFGDPPGYVSAESRYKSVWGLDPHVLAAWRLLGEDRTKLRAIATSVTPAVARLQRDCGF